MFGILQWVNGMFIGPKDYIIIHINNLNIFNTALVILLLLNI